MDTKSLVDMCLVACGGAAGALLRHFSGLSLNKGEAVFPVGTLAVNLAGCFLIGMLYGWGLAVGQSRTRALVATGFLGALTTMSAFSIETLAMTESGNRVAAVSYVGISIAGCIACAALGAAVARWISAGAIAPDIGD